MRTYIIRRILQMIPVFFGVILILFVIFHFAPGDVVSSMIDPKMSPAQKSEMRERLGVDKPFYEKFTSWTIRFFQGDLGDSVSHKKPVSQLISEYIGSTFRLSFISLIVAMLIGIPIGIISATKQYSVMDTVFTIFSLIGISLPAFFFALLLLKAFAVELQWFPMFGLQDPMMKMLGTGTWISEFLDLCHHLVLPVVVLGMASSASFMRYTRTSMLEVIKQDYIRTARAKGLKEKVVIYKHAFRNAMIPIITLLGFSLPGLFSGAITTESIFGLPGVGKLSVDAVMTRDYNVVLGINAMLCIFTLVGALLADILYAAADPRIRFD